jgi:hypothetical protein
MFVIKIQKSEMSKCSIFRKKGEIDLSRAIQTRVVIGDEFHDNLSMAKGMFILPLIGSRICLNGTK